MIPDEFYAAARQSDMSRPYVPSETRWCGNCGVAVWVDKKLTTFADSMTILCFPCAVESSQQYDDVSWKVPNA